jgi:hypothetical protein
MGELSVALLQNRNQIILEPENHITVIEAENTTITISTDGAQGPEGPPPEGSSIPQLDELLSLENTDLLVIYDASTSTTKHVQLSTLKAFVLA